MSRSAIVFLIFWTVLVLLTYLTPGFFVLMVVAMFLVYPFSGFGGIWVASILAVSVYSSILALLLTFPKNPSIVGRAGEIFKIRFIFCVIFFGVLIAVPIFLVSMRVFPI